MAAPIVGRLRKLERALRTTGDLDGADWMRQVADGLENGAVAGCVPRDQATRRAAVLLSGEMAQWAFERFVLPKLPRLDYVRDDAGPFEPVPPLDGGLCDDTRAERMATLQKLVTKLESRRLLLDERADCLNCGRKLDAHVGGRCP